MLYLWEKKNYTAFSKNIKQDVNNRKIAYIQVFLRRENKAQFAPN